MNKFPFPSPVLRPGLQVALLTLIAALPGPTLAQKTTAAPPAVTPAASSPASGPSLALSPKEALAQKQMLDGDKRLDRVMTLDVISVPLDEVLQKQSADKGTGVKPDPERLILTASHNCEDLKLQIRLNRRPLRTLMTALAEMLPGTWTRTREGYNLSLTDKAVVARAEWWRLFLGEREKALAAQHQAVLSAMQTKARRRQADDPEPAEPTDHAVEEEMANQHDFFHSLPQALKEQIAANLDDSSFYEVQGGFGNDGERFGTVGWLSQMPPETQERFKAAMQDNVSRLAQAPPAYQKYAAQAQRDLATFDPSKVYFLFQNGGFVVYATPFNGPSSAGSTMDLHMPGPINTPALRLDQTALAAVVYGGAEVPPYWKHRADTARGMGDAAPPDMKMLVYAVYGMGDAAPPEWKQLAAYQRGRVWPNTLPKLPPEERGTQIIPTRPVISRAAQTDWLGERGGMEYVCDYYSHGGYSMPEAQRKLPVRRQMATELDEMAAKRDVSWRKDADGITLIRNNHWYRDDSLEVPQPLLRRWFARLLQARQQEAAAQAAVPPAPQSPKERTAALKQNCDWAAEVYNTLTPWQLRNGLALFQPEERDLAPQNDATAAKLFERLKHEKPQGIAPPDYDDFIDMTRMPPFWSTVNAQKRYPHTIHLYGSLDDAARTALLEGRLPASTLTPAQLAEATSLQPLLPQALQSFPADSVLLDLPDHWSPSSRIVFGAVPFTNLAVKMPQSTPPPPASPQ